MNIAEISVDLTCMRASRWLIDLDNPNSTPFILPYLNAETYSLDRLRPTKLGAEPRDAESQRSKRQDLQDQAGQFALTPRARLFEHVLEMRACRRQRNAELLRGSAQPMSRHDRKRDLSLTACEAKKVDQQFGVCPLGVARVVDQNNCSRS